MRKKLLLLLLLVGIGPPVWAAGTCTVSNITSSQNASVRVPDAETVIVTLTCTADASAGTYPSTTIPLTGAYPSGTVLNSYNLTGFVLYQVGRTPGATNPTANYSVTITDTKSFALDLGLLTSNGAASTSQLTAIASGNTSFPVVRSALTVAITGNAVNSASITLDLIFRAGGALSSATGVFSNWTASTPVPTCTGGSGTLTSTMNKETVGKTVFINFEITITATGTCATHILEPLGFTPAADLTLSCSENVNTGLAWYALLLSSTANASLARYDNSFTITNNMKITCSGVIQSS